MNPNRAIRPWLLACGGQFGIRHAFDYRWPDEDTRPEEFYCTYQSISGVPAQTGWQGDKEITNTNDVTRSGMKQHTQTYQIDLYNSQDGLYELEAFCVAAQFSPALRELFAAEGCEFVAASSITNETIFDDSTIEYHFRLICTFTEYVEISLDEVNALVRQIDLTLDSDHTVQSIFIDGIIGTTGDLVATGSATLTEV